MKHGIPRSNEIGIDGRVLLFTAGVSLLTGVLFGLFPALQTSKTDLHAVLKEGGRSGSAQRSVRGLFVVVEVAAALVLLVGAGLLLKSFQKLQEVNPGFKPDHLLTMQIALPANQVQGPATDRRLLPTGAGKDQSAARRRVSRHMHKFADERIGLERQLFHRRSNRCAGRNVTVGQSLVCRRDLFSDDGNPAGQRTLL